METLIGSSNYDISTSQTGNKQTLDKIFAKVKPIEL